MLAIIFLAEVSRCASPAFCPTDAQLIAAFRDRRDLWSRATGTQADAQDPANIHLIEPMRIIGIGDVRCGEPRGSNGRVTCSYVVNYAGGHTTNDKALLRRKANGWAIEADTAFSNDPSR